MIIACKSCNRKSVALSNRSYEASGGKGESRSESEPDTASLHKREWPTVRIRRSLEPTEKKQVSASVRLPGVIEDSAHRKIGQELGRPLKVSVRDERHNVGKHNRISDLSRESERLILVRKSCKRDGAKGPCCE